MSNDKEFNEWFNGLLLFDKSSCANRDILRWAKPILKHGWGYQLYSDLEYKGSQEFVDAWLNKTLEPQNNELKKIIEKKDEEILRLKNANNHNNDISAGKIQYLESELKKKDEEIGRYKDLLKRSEQNVSSFVLRSDILKALSEVESE